jgi:hypothetical protein
MSENGYAATWETRMDRLSRKMSMPNDLYKEREANTVTGVG